MDDEYLQVDSTLTSSNSGTQDAVRPGEAVTNALTTVGDVSPIRIPISIPSNQLYYWTRKWQEGEQEALREIEAGKGRRFESARDAIHWLLSDD